MAILTLGGKVCSLLPKKWQNRILQGSFSASVSKPQPVSEDVDGIKAQTVVMGFTWVMRDENDTFERFVGNMTRGDSISISSLLEQRPVYRPEGAFIWSQLAGSDSTNEYQMEAGHLYVLRHNGEDRVFYYDGLGYARRIAYSDGDCLFDLTLMFGRGHEPSLEDFYRMFPDEHYPYNNGEIIRNGRGYGGLEAQARLEHHLHRTRARQFANDIQNRASSFDWGSVRMDEVSRQMVETRNPESSGDHFHSHRVEWGQPRVTAIQRIDGPVSGVSEEATRELSQLSERFAEQAAASAERVRRMRMILDEHPELPRVGNSTFEALCNTAQAYGRATVAVDTADRDREE